MDNASPSLEIHYAAVHKALSPVAAQQNLWTQFPILNHFLLFIWNLPKRCRPMSSICHHENLQNECNVNTTYRFWLKRNKTALHLPDRAANFRCFVMFMWFATESGRELFSPMWTFWFELHRGRQGFYQPGNTRGVIMNLKKKVYFGALT